MIIHIAEDYDNKTFCGRKAIVNTAWKTKVFRYLRTYKKTVWCKTCKNLYNANHASELTGRLK